MAAQLLRPSVLDEGLRSELFLSGLRRTGKATFVLSDLVPALQEAGAVVIYVDLWSDVRSDPAILVHEAIRAGTDVVLIVDEVQQAITTEEGHRTLLALKAARDAINPRPDTPGRFLFVGTGSHRALVSELTSRRNQAFAGATSVAYPVLEGDHVDHLLARLDPGGAVEAARTPSREVAVEAFATLGHRPEELLRALRLLRRELPPGGDPDAHLLVIAAALRTSAVDVEPAKVDGLGALAAAIFERVASGEGGGRGLFSAAAASGFSTRLGREVRIEEVQPLVNELVAANLIMRRGHGHYDITDPFVRRIWCEREALAGRAPEPSPDDSRHDA